MADSIDGQAKIISALAERCDKLSVKSTSCEMKVGALAPNLYVMSTIADAKSLIVAIVSAIVDITEVCAKSSFNGLRLNSVTNF